MQGAWQPSLNISTVLTSIGLLLSEPNPDDGLMCEAVSIGLQIFGSLWLPNKSPAGKSLEEKKMWFA